MRAGHLGTPLVPTPPLREEQETASLTLSLPPPPATARASAAAVEKGGVFPCPFPGEAEFQQDKRTYDVAPLTNTELGVPLKKIHSPNYSKFPLIGQQIALNCAS